MALGRFGGRGPQMRIQATSGGGGGDPVSDATGDSERLTLPSTEGMPAGSGQVMTGLKNLSHDLVFSSTDNDTVAWAAGTIMMSDGVSYAIGGANTGNMAALTYIYFDRATSLTALQTTATYSTASGDEKQLIAIAVNVVAGRLAALSVF